MSVLEFISIQPKERRELLLQLHEIILETDKNVTSVVALMMGKEMIVYNAPGTFKYGLSSVKNYMSLHVLPLYASLTHYEKYKGLLKNANFQKGCINFKAKDEMPVKIVRDMISDCSKIDFLAIRKNQIKFKSKKK